MPIYTIFFENPFYLQNFKFIGAMVSEFRVSKEEAEEDENHV